MGKNKKDSAKRGARSRNMKQHDALARINFLYQAAHSMVLHNLPLSRIYIRTLKRLAKKLVIRLDPVMKHSMCPRCDTLLVPGVTSVVRTHARREKHVSLSCGTCGHLRRKRSRTQRDSGPNASKEALDDEHKASPQGKQRIL